MTGPNVTSRRLAIPGALLLAGLSLTACSSNSATDTASKASTAASSAAGSASSAASSAATAAKSSASSAVSGSSYTMAQVKTHNSSSSCWAVINKNVYNLTAWISKHPGGPDKITSICGKDGTSAFNGQHSKDAEPKEDLTKFKIGTLKG